MKSFIFTSMFLLIFAGSFMLEGVSFADKAKRSIISQAVAQKMVSNMKAHHAVVVSRRSLIASPSPIEKAIEAKQDADYAKGLAHFQNMSLPSPVPGK